MAIYGNTIKDMIFIKESDLVVDNYDYLDEDFELYLAEDELFKTIFTFGEDTNNIVNESVKDAIVDFINKFIAAVQNVWNKFKDFVLNGPDTLYLNSIKDKVASFKGLINIENYHSLEMDEFDNIKMPRGVDPEEITTTEDFMSKYFPKLDAIKGDDGQDLSVTEKLRKLCSKSGKLENQPIQSIYQNATTEFKKRFDALQSETAQVTTEYRNAGAAVRDIVQANKATTTNNTGNNSSNESFTYDDLRRSTSILFEADDDKKEPTNKVEVDSDGDGQVDDKKAADSLLSKFKIGLGCISKVLTAKMTVLRDFRKENIRILKQVFKEDKEAQKNGNNNQNTENTENKQ